MRLIVDPAERRICLERFKRAAKMAQKSICRKSHRGVEIIAEDGEIIGVGWSCQTDPQQCEKCPRLDDHSNGNHFLCLELHAEQVGITNALEMGNAGKLKNSKMFHVKTDPVTGAIRSSSAPSCTWCSRYIFSRGIYYYLLHDNGGEFEDWNIVEYSPEEINQISLENALKAV